MDSGEANVEAILEQRIRIAAAIGSTPPDHESDNSEWPLAASILLKAFGIGVPVKAKNVTPRGIRVSDYL